MVLPAEIRLRVRTMTLLRYVVCGARGIGALLLGISLGGAIAVAAKQKSDEAYLWLEEVQGEKALHWVKEQNERSLKQLRSYSDYGEFKEQALHILQAKDKIPMGQIRGGYVYNFWQDADHVRGLLRRSPWEAYKNGKPQWEDVLDIDALAKAEGKSYVYGGSECLRPKLERCMITLSEGGSDAASYREFDTTTKSFVKGGFTLSASKSSLEWLDQDTLLFADATRTEALTESGYPLEVRLWKRGQDPKDSRFLFKGEKADVSVSAAVFRDKSEEHVIVMRSPSFFTSEYRYLQKDGQLKLLPLPIDMQLHGVFEGQAIVSNRSPLPGFAQGSLLSVPMKALLEGKTPYQLVFAPNEQQALNGVVEGQGVLYVSLLEQVRNKVLGFERGADGTWKSRLLPLDDKGTVGLISVDEDSDRMLVSYQDFLVPPSLFSLEGKDWQKQLVMQLQPRFSSEGLEIRQEFAKSSDGTAIPYFIVHKKGLALNGKNPTLLYGYGGFEVPLQPSYSAVTGKLWLERGGVYVLANIRGGGEFGPRWHQAALQENRQKAFDDFAAVAQDLITRKITEARHLGIQGGSNGGLLMGASFTQHPELFQAVICQVPLLDMLRFHKLLAGASWVGEYGSPEDPKMRPIISRYSPFQNLKAEKHYPEVFFVTSTKDDRVHPGHARKMAARMEDMKKPFFYFENIEGGHSASANLQQSAERYALEYSYLWMKLK